MHLIEVTPAPCVVCGRGNVNDSRDPVTFVDLERDVNWSDPVILCEDCAAKVGGMVGMMSADERQALHLEIRRKDTQIHGLQAENDSMKRRAHRLGMTFAEAK